MLALTSMALVIAVIGATVGAVFGLIAGNVVWRALADGVHVAPDVRLPLVALVLVVPVAAVAAALVAGIPGWQTARMDIADVLRTE